MALGSRLRLLTSKMTDDAAKIYALYNVEFAPKWFPALFILADEGPKTITEIAESIGHSQPSVTKIIKEMIAAGLVLDNLESADKRQNIVGLSDQGHALAQHVMQEQSLDVEAAVDGLIQEATYNLWEAVAEWEFLLEKKESPQTRAGTQKVTREQGSKDCSVYTCLPVCI